MKRWIIIVVMILLGGITYHLFKPQPSTITVTDARAAPMGAGGEMFMVSLNMKNDGPAVGLAGVSSPNGATVSLMNPNGTGPLVVPQNSSGILAMDGAHIMLSVPTDGFKEGAFQPISLHFDDGTTLATRVMRQNLDDGMGQMRHGLAHAVEVSPSPELTLFPPQNVDADGFEIKLGVKNFQFVVAADDADHVPNQGHAHVYLNGLKLGRLYEDTFQIGGLASGTYTLSVALNTNDHRPYARHGAAIEARFEFTLP